MAVPCKGNGNTCIAFAVPGSDYCTVHRDNPTFIPDRNVPDHIARSTYKGLSGACAACDGSGVVTQTEECDACDGSGECSGECECQTCGRSHACDDSCHVCNGTGTTPFDDSCEQCQGSGRATA